jgi:hypothetical protein
LAIAPQSLAPNGVVAQMSPVAYAGFGDASWDGDGQGLARDGYSTGSMPRVRDYEPSGAAPSYPNSWGSAPEKAPAKSQFATGPRSRFS